MLLRSYRLIKSLRFLQILLCGWTTHFWFLSKTTHLWNILGNQITFIGTIVKAIIFAIGTICGQWWVLTFNAAGYAVIFTHANSMEAKKVCTDITGVKLQTLLSTWFNTMDIEITSIDLQKLRSNHNHKHNAVIKIYLKIKLNYQWYMQYTLYNRYHPC